MQKKQWKKMLSLILCTMLIAAMALVTTACGDDAKEGNLATEGPTQQNLEVLGNGKTTFNFTVVEENGTESVFEIHTDKTTVGEALLDLGLISGEEGPYGLYVKTVNGITADYDTNGTYWAFYIDGAYAVSGVDVTDITEGAEYSFKVEK